MASPQNHHSHPISREEFLRTLDERLAAHEIKASLQLERVRAEMVEQQQKQLTQLELHNKRLEIIEDNVKGWRSWGLGIAGAVIVAIVQTIMLRH